MSLEATVSPTGNKPLPPGETEAEFTEPNKPPKPAKPPRPNEARPLDTGSVFGGTVADTPNASKQGARRPETGQGETNDPAKRGRGRPRKGEPKPPVVVTDKHRAAAMAAVRAMEGIPKVVAARRYSTVFSAAQLDDVAAALTYTDAERELLVGPLAQGAAEHGLEVPWWAEFGFAAMMVTLPRFAMFSEFEKQADAEWKRQGKGAPPPVAKEPS